MSGGQRQRLAIARALVRDPRVLVLDEATSALDPQTEAEVQQTLRELSHGRTTIAITHRLASVSDVDRIFVIDRHRLVEEGTHDELLAREGLYYSLYQEQLTSGGPPERQVDVKSARLRSVPLFAELPPDVLVDLAERVRVDHFTSGDTLVCQGDVAEDLYFMISGRAEVVASADGGPPRPLATLNQGDAFGLRTLDAIEPSAATVRAVTDVDAYSLPKTAFAALLERHPDLAAAVSAAMYGSATPRAS
jgi:ATP-binding cassette, subfamily B, bacterial